MVYKLNKIKIYKGKKECDAKKRKFNAQHALGYHDDGGRNGRWYVMFLSAQLEIMHFMNRIPIQYGISIQLVDE